MEKLNRRKKMKIIEQLELQKDIEVPYNVWRMFGKQCKLISIAGSQASLGEDYGTTQELREAIKFYVEQLGGTVKWSK
jgi:RNase P subunit RPR2